MEYESNKLINTRYNWGKGDKILLLRIQMAISALIIFLGIVQATNIYLLNKAQDNSITFGFFVTVILVVILSAICILWSIQTSKKISISDNPMNSSNTKFSQIIFYVTLLLLTLYIVFFVIFQFAKADLFNAAQASQVEYNQAYENSYNDHQQWVSTLGYIIIVLLVLTCYTEEIMTDSRSCANLMIYLISTVLLFVSFFILHELGVLRSVYNYPSLNLLEWPLTVLKVVAILSLILLIFTVIINSKRKEVSYLLAGTLFILLIALVVPATGAIFRQYNDSNSYYTSHCSEELGHVDQAFLAKQGCQNKYRYKEGSQKDCGNRFEDCFETIQSMAKINIEKKKFITQVWEESLYPKAVSEPRLAGLSEQCCGTVANIYSRPILKIAALALAFIILAFILVCFLYKNSTHPSQPNELVLSAASKTLLIFLFVAVFAIGGLYLILSDHTSDIVRRDTVVVNKVITIKHSTPSNTYHEVNKCTAFKYLDDKLLFDTSLSNTLLSDIALKASDTYCDKNSNSNCLHPDLLVIIQSFRLPSESCPSAFNFKYLSSSDNQANHVHIIPSSLIMPLASSKFCMNAATKQPKCISCSQYLGIVGESNAVLNYIKENVQVCNKEESKFLLEAFQVDPNLFGNPSPPATPQSLTSAKKAPKTIQPLKKAIIHAPSQKSLLEESSNENRLLASSLTKHTIQLIIRDIATGKLLQGANISLYEQQQYVNDNTCEPDQGAQKIFSGISDANGNLDLDFIFATPPFNPYTVHVKMDNGRYAVNCRTFIINVNNKFLDVGLSPTLAEHQIRFLLEWGSQSTLQVSSDLDLFLSSNSVEDNWTCYSSYFNSQCAGTVHHGDQLGKQISSEAITIQNLGQIKYLVFFKIPVVSSTNGAIDNSIITELKPILKVFTPGQTIPTQTMTFDSSIGKGTYESFEADYRFANLVWCVNGINSEIVEKLKDQTTPIAWQIIDPDAKYDLPLASKVC